MNLWEIKVEIAASAAAAADELLLELGREAWGVYEDVIVGRAWVQGILPSREDCEREWSELQPAMAEVGVSFLGEAQLRSLGDQDWKDSYKAHFKASRFGPLHWVPEWERQSYALPEGDVVLWLDPGLAFGTGNHETTRLCCERLVTYCGQNKVAGRRLIDAGCGSGILALSASLLGFSHIEAFDIDPEAVRISGENAAMNGLEGRVHFSTDDLVTGLRGKQADLVLANIQADVLLRFADELLAAVAPGGTLVLSGILAHERDKVRAAFAAKATGWTIDSRILGEWSDVVLVRN